MTPDFAPERAQPTDQRGDGFDDVRDQLNMFIKFHDAVACEMAKLQAEQTKRQSRDLEAEKVEADEQLVRCLRFFREVNGDGWGVINQVMMHVRDVIAALDESKACYDSLQTRFNELQAQNDHLQQQRDMTQSMALVFLAVAIYHYIY